MALSRRTFVLLCAAGAPGIWLGGGEVIALPRHIVLVLGGQCSFCGKSSESVQGLAGAVGKKIRVCDECLGLCRDILDELEGAPRGAASAARHDAYIEEIKEDLERAKAEGDGRVIDTLQRIVDGEPLPHYAPPQGLVCTFCDRAQADVKKLIAGPTVYICDGCIATASHVLVA